MTKEEILFKISGVRNIHHTIYSASEVEMAMEEYAKQKCIAFMDAYLLGEIPFEPWYKEVDDAQELYELYLKSKT